MRMIKNEPIFEELREIGKDLRSEKYLVAKEMQKGVILKSEDLLLKTLTEEQIALFKQVEKSLWDYVEIAENEAFYHGFQMAKAIIGK